VCNEALEECICECEECGELLKECVCECEECKELLRECICPCEDCKDEDCEKCGESLEGCICCVDCFESPWDCICVDDEHESISPTSAFIDLSAEIAPSAARTYDLREQFVIRLYTNVLGRNYDTPGLNNWVNHLRNGRSGANVASGFFFSPEFLSRRLDNGQYVDILYRTLLGREPDVAGRAHYLARLHSGIPRENIFASLVISNEFEALCRQANIVRGTYTPPPGAMARVFVTRLYRTTLGREPDAGGLNNWTNHLINGRSGAAVAYGFVFSPEMFARNLTNDQFVEVLYNAMLGRPSDAVGKAHWVSRLNGGHSRYHVFVAFVESPEFGSLCSAHGIVRGNAPPPANMMPGNTTLDKTWNMIILAHFGGISDRPEHIAGIIGNMQAEAGTNLCPFQQQVSNQIGLGLMQWSFGRRINLENYMWNSGINPNQFRTEMNKHLTTTCDPRNPNHQHPPALLDRALQVQINFMFHEFRNTSERAYMSFVDFPTNRLGVAGARAYAELFCAISLRPGDGGPTNNILDPGVLNALQASSHVGGLGRLDRISYSNLNGRRANAERVYRYFLTNHG